MRLLPKPTARFHSIDIINTEGNSEQTWNWHDTKDEVDESFVHLCSNNKADEEFTVHVNEYGVSIESWDRKTDTRTGVKAIDFKNIPGIFED